MCPLLMQITGTAVGNNYIYRTTNGGASWVTQSVGVGLQAVFFSDANNGTAVGYPGAILRTTDGGSTGLRNRVEHHTFCGMFALSMRKLVPLLALILCLQQGRE